MGLHIFFSTSSFNIKTLKKVKIKSQLPRIHYAKSLPAP